MNRHSTHILLILGVVYLLCSVCLGQRHNADSTPGEFDFYLLNLSWAPTFCATHSSHGSALECDPSRHNGFIVHGLWPQNNDGSYPQSCAPAQPVSQAIVQSTLTVMPSRGLIQHEWATHGTCSGLSSSDYFGDIRQVFSQLRIPQQFRSTPQGFSMAPADVEKQFAAANNAPSDAFRVSCSGGQLVAVEACLTKDLQFQRCGPAVRDCRASQVTVPPVP